MPDGFTLLKGYLFCLVMSLIVASGFAHTITSSVSKQTDIASLIFIKSMAKQ